MEQTLQNILLNNQTSFSEQFFEPYHKINSKEISHYVKNLKRDSLLMNDAYHVKNMSALSLSIISFMSEEKAYQSQLYSQALTTLNNALNMKNQFLGTIKIKQMFYKNLQLFFSAINIEKEMNYEEIKLKNFHIYSILYLVVMIIYKNNSKEQKEIIMENLFTKKFILEFLSLQIPKVHKIQKIVGTIILFISKNVNIKNWGKKIKQFLLQNLDLAAQENNQFYFFYSFRQIKQLLEISQIRRYSFIQFCITCLKNHVLNQSYAIYIYQIIMSILKRYHLLGYSFIRLGLIPLLEKGIKTHQNYILAIFQMMSSCLPFNIKQKAIDYHVQKFCLVSEKENQLTFSLKILRIFFKQFSQSQIMKLVQCNFIQKLLFIYSEIYGNSDKKIILNLIYLYFLQIKQYNQCIFKFICKNCILNFVVEKMQENLNDKNKQILAKILEMVGSGKQDLLQIQ